MSRRSRGLVEGLIYHVYNRAGRGEAPFKLEDEADRFWSLPHEVKKRERNERWVGGRLEQLASWTAEPAFARRLDELDRKLAGTVER
ncbi:MAG: hypothetical protein B7Z68_03205 [Acidobacteria bacterium 21-70-11]|nr:MAG: hypothetical protein B7Z68_03205 [Acidobacteria bacterium 21-70-11]HQT95051.1 hypothetical protein [Thermoanaerobaculaceae bacterium]HQU33130.1 hypothetical protein [Thermoanaerobaculaceae bacterium]